MAIPSAWFGCPICKGKALRRRELWECATTVKCFSCGEWSKPDVLIGNEPTGAEMLAAWMKEKQGRYGNMNYYPDGTYYVQLYYGKFLAVGTGKTLDAAMRDGIKKARAK